MKIAIQMDHISSINPLKDTSFALLWEAQRRGFELYHYTPEELSWQEGKIIADSERLQVFAPKEGQEQRHFALSDRQKRDLSAMDVVLLRQDPPFNMAYITTTFILEQLPKNVLVLNNPSAVRNHPEKMCIAQFADIMPQTVITRRLDDLLEFHAKYPHMIVKPLYGNGGEGVFYLRPDDPNVKALFETLCAYYKEPFVLQRYLPEVALGDKRILLVEGEAIGAINRVPRQGEARSNMHVGGQAQPSDLTERDLQICAHIAPFLKQNDFVLVGIDVIGDLLTEINVTSPTGVQELRNFGGSDVAVVFWDKIAKRRFSTKQYS